MFIRGVLMIKLVLDQASQSPEFGNVLSQQIHFVHRAEDGSDIAPLVEQGQKGFADVPIRKKTAVDQAKLITDQLCQIGMQTQPTLLGIEENTHESTRLVAENPWSCRMNLAIGYLET